MILQETVFACLSTRTLRTENRKYLKKKVLRVLQYINTFGKLPKKKNGFVKLTIKYLIMSDILPFRSGKKYRFRYRKEYERGR